jgi:predicted nucleic acid-binding protein
LQRGIESLYSFDDDFARLDWVTRLDTAAAPFD